MERLSREGGAAGFAVVALWASLGLLGAALTVFFTPLDQQLNPQDFPELPPEILDNIAVGTQIVVPLTAVLTPFIWWPVLSLLMQLATRFFGGSGSLGRMFTVIGVACVPFALLAAIQLPISGLQIALGFESAASATLGLLSNALSLAALGWHIALVIIGARFARQVSYGQSGGSCALSCVGCGGLAILVIAVLVAVFAAVIGAAGGA